MAPRQLNMHDGVWKGSGNNDAFILLIFMVSIIHKLPFINPYFFSNQLQIYSPKHRYSEIPFLKGHHRLRPNKKKTLVSRGAERSKGEISVWYSCLSQKKGRENKKALLVHMYLTSGPIFTNIDLVAKLSAAAAAKIVASPCPPFSKRRAYNDPPLAIEADKWDD